MSSETIDFDLDFGDAFRCRYEAHETDVGSAVLSSVICRIALNSVRDNQMWRNRSASSVRYLRE